MSNPETPIQGILGTRYSPAESQPRPEQSTISILPDTSHKSA